MRTLLLTTLVIISPVAFAGVNVQNASYTETATDIQLEGFQLTRSYSSRSLHNGLFGFGWCSNLEKSLIANPDGSIKIRNCQKDQDDVFYRQAPTDDRLVYTRPGTAELILFKESRFELRSDQGVDFFSKEGLWLEHQQVGLRVRIGYGIENRPNRLWLNDTLIHLEYLDGKIRRVYNENIDIEYQVKTQDLVFTKSSLGQNTIYQYDQLHNLTTVKVLDGPRKHITYQTSEDRVLKVDHGTGCVEIYRYVNLSKLEYQVQRQTECEGKKSQSLYSFQFAQVGENLRMRQIRILSGRVTLNTEYSDLGRPSRSFVKMGEDNWQVDYDSLGQPNQVHGPSKKLVAALGGLIAQGGIE